MSTAAGVQQQRDLLQLSSGEQRRIALALTLGFAELIAQRGQVSSNLLVVDEVRRACLGPVNRLVVLK